jgi:hypothetical protein
VDAQVARHVVVNSVRERRTHGAADVEHSPRVTAASTNGRRCAGERRVSSWRAASRASASASRGLSVRPSTRGCTCSRRCFGISCCAKARALRAAASGVSALAMLAASSGGQPAARRAVALRAGTSTRPSSRSVWRWGRASKGTWLLIASYAAVRSSLFVSTAAMDPPSIAAETNSR